MKRFQIKKQIKSYKMICHNLLKVKLVIVIQTLIALEKAETHLKGLNKNIDKKNDKMCL